jgi:hypothetical protein
MLHEFKLFRRVGPRGGWRTEARCVRCDVDFISLPEDQEPKPDECRPVASSEPLRLHIARRQAIERLPER